MIIYGCIQSYLSKSSEPQLQYNQLSVKTDETETETNDTVQINEKTLNDDDDTIFEENDKFLPENTVNETLNLSKLDKAETTNTTQDVWYMYLREVLADIDIWIVTFLYATIMPISDELYNAIRFVHNIEIFMDTWKILSTVEFIIPIAIQSILLIIVFFKRDFFTKLNLLMGYRIFTIGVGLMSLFFIGVNSGPVLYLIAGMSSVLAVLAQVLILMLTINCCFKYEIGLVLAMVPKVSSIHTLLLYPLHCLGPIGTFITFAIATISLGMGLSFWRLTPNINLPKSTPREPTNVLHWGWIWFFVLPICFFLVGGGILIMNGFPCPVPTL